MRKLVFLLIILFVWSCQNSSDRYGNGDPSVVNSLDISSVSDTLDLDVSFISEKVEIIPLAKTHEALVGGGHNTYAISEDFIVIETNKTLLLYNRDGSFNRLLSKHGKGPGEYVYIRLMKIYEQMLYYTDAGKPGNELQGINLKTGESVAVELAVPSGRLNDYTLSDKGLTTVADSVKEERYIRFLYQQNSNGELLREDFLSSRAINNRVHLGPYNFLQTQETLYMVNSQGDSIMNVEGSKPELDFKFELPDVQADSKGHDRAIQLNTMSYNSAFLLAIKRTISIQPGKIRMSFPHYFYVNRVAGESYFFEKFDIREFGLKLSPLSLCIEEAPLLCFEIHAIDFMEMAAEAGADQHVMALAKDLNENSNPVLIIAKIGK